MDSSNALFSAHTNHSPSAVGGSNSSAEGIDIAHYLRLILGNKWKILAFTCLIVAIVAIQVKPMRAVYQASATILIDTGRAQSSSEGVFGDAGSRNYLNTQFGLLNSRVFVERVVERLDLTRHPEYDPNQYVPNPSLFEVWINSVIELVIPKVEEEVSHEALKRSVVDIVKEGITIVPARGTQLVGIIAETNDPLLSSSIANELADVYIESYLEANLEAAQKSAAWLSGRLGELQGNLRAAEDELIAYRESEGLVDVQGVTTLDAAELSQLRIDFTAARQERIGAENLAREVSRLVQVEPLQLLNILEIANNPAIQQLQIENDLAERRLAELGRTYGQRHPQIVAARDDQQKAAQRLITRLQTVAKGITDNYQRALATENQLSRQVNASQSRLQNLGRKEVKLRELERRVEINRQVYEVMLSRGKEADQSVSFQDSPARIIDQALPPKEPVGPNKKKFVLMGAAFAIGLSLSIILILDLLDSPNLTTPGWYVWF